MSERNAKAENTKQVSIDPRISSPQIKVVYPSLRTEQPSANQPEISLPRSPEQSQGLSEVSKPAVIQSTAQQSAPQTVTDQTGSTPAIPEPEPSKKPTWLEVVKQNTALIFVVALTGFAIGFFIAKNK